MNRSLLTLLILGALIAIAYFFSNRISLDSASSPTDSPPIVGNGTTSPPARETKVFQVEGVPYSFTPQAIRVNQGDLVKIEFTSSNGLHDWVLDEFNVRTAQLAAGESETVEFIADKQGTYEYYCSVGNHRQMGMRGNLIVE